MQIKVESNQLLIDVGAYRSQIRPLGLLIALFTIALLCKLGFWQLHRAAEKRQMLAEMKMHPELRTLDQFKLPIPAYTHVKLEGHFHENHSFIIENRHYKHRLGYQVLSPFHLQSLDKTVVIDRGWIPYRQTGIKSSDYKTPSGKLSVKGVVYYPKKPFSLRLDEMKNETWPQILPQLDMNKIRNQLQYEKTSEQKRLISKTGENKLNQKIPSFIIVLDLDQPGSLQYNFNPVVLTPARHVGYAVQWLACAFAAACAFIALSITKKHSDI